MSGNDSDTCPCLDPDPDVAGIGAIISFVLTAGLTWICSVVALVFNLSGSDNPIDQATARYLERALVALVRQFAPDTAQAKLMTGLAVLISAWIRLRAGLSVYHFSIINDLAIMASDTQLLAFFALFQCAWSAARRAEDAESAQSASQDHPALARVPSASVGALCASMGAMSASVAAPSASESVGTRSASRSSELPEPPDIQPYLYLPSRLFRATGMLCMCIMLIVAAALVSDRAWYDCMSIPATDYLSHYKTGGGQLGWLIYACVMLPSGYCQALIPLFGPTDRVWRAIKKAIFRGHTWRKITTSTSKSDSWRKRMLRVVLQFLDSSVYGLALSAVWFGVGVWSIVSDRAQSSYYELCQGDDTQAEWGFGQLVPMVLIGLPVLATLDAYGKATGAKNFATLPHLRVAVSSRLVSAQPEKALPRWALIRGTLRARQRFRGRGDYVELDPHPHSPPVDTPSPSSPVPR
ncbi:hypothetical protein B0H14DRAFT_2669803 [Mycena olivaceomarginata]|nr:hypothetical protein B0H14DRAFT_2669803 [Mycena olivaceomarginata]